MTTYDGPAHTMERLIENDQFMAWCKRCPWQKSAPLKLRESVDIAAAEHLMVGNMFGRKRKNQPTTGGKPKMENTNSTPDGTIGEPGQSEQHTFDQPNNSDDNGAPVAPSATGDQASGETVLADKPDADPKFSKDEAVYETEQQPGSPSQREGRVLAVHDDGSVTVGYYASVERVAADTLTGGSPTEAAEDK